MYVEAVTLGLILFVIGLLITAYGFSRFLDFFTVFFGIAIMGIGGWILAAKFRHGFLDIRG